ncbi:MAG: lysylphosphatidylglycerol synthase domain-containing protein, partial [Myxococcota bacterium]
IARFWGAFTPGGFTGFGGWRIFDVAKHTGKTARATAVIGVEVVLGQLAFGVVCMAASIFGFSLVGLRGLLMVNGFFVVVISAGLFFLARPRLFLGALRVLPQAVRGRIRSLVDAVMAYDGKGALLTQAGALGIGTHTFNNLIYVCAARALDVELSIGTVFFGSSLQIFATLIPASINGIGLRETAAVALYTTVGVALTDAILIPTVGFAAEMFVSAFGGLVFLLRRGDYAPGIVVEDHEREIPAETDSRPVPKALWPRPLTGLSTGLAAGMLAGVLVGLGEAAVVVFSGGGRSGLGVLWYGALAYGVFCGFAGGGLGFTLALTHRWMRRAAPSSAISYSRMTAAVVAVFGFALGAFRVRRDAFDEALVWKSGLGLAVLSGCVLAASLLFLLLNRVLLWAVKRRVGQALPKIWGSFAFSATLVSFAVVLSMFGSQASSGTYVSREHGLPVAAPHAEDAGDILFIVVDTLRADHLPSYGYERGSTPALDAFAQDAIRFDQAFANASWTRPSFASLLSG